jgi:hypothetical protein
VRADIPSGTVTFLFTDIAGSTRLIEELGEDGYVEPPPPKPNSHSSPEAALSRRNRAANRLRARGSDPAQVVYASAQCAGS